MPTFKPADKSIADLLKRVINTFPDHAPLVDVKIDLVLAYPDTNDNGDPVNDALTLRGMKALGITRKLNLKDRAMGRGDAEITLDGPYVEGSPEPEVVALMDHELAHIQVREKNGEKLTADLGRPELKLRKHDHEFGWFERVAQRHGAHSQERIQAARMMDSSGQAYWPEIFAQTELNSNLGRFGKMEMPTK